MKRLIVVFLSCAGAFATAEARKVTVEDLMRLRTISEVQIAPDGERVAYVLSEPSFEKDGHEAVLYVLAAGGGMPLRLTYGTRIFNQPIPHPHLRWLPDGKSISFVGFAGDTPQVFMIDVAGGEPRAVTDEKEGVTEYEWSPDSQRIAYLAPDPAPEEEQRRQKEKSYVIEVDRHQRPPRVRVKDLAGGDARALSPADLFAANLCWSPDGSTIAYSASREGGFVGQFHTRIYTVPVSGGEPRFLVERDGMNTSPQYSPDGQWVAFISTGGVPEMVSIWGLHAIPAGGGTIRNLSAVNQNWVGDFVWAADSSSILYLPNEGTGQRGARMFEVPVLRVSLDGKTEEVSSGAAANYSISLSRDGKRLAYRSVEARTMGDLVVMELASRATHQLTEVNPELKELELGALEPISWRSFDGMEIWGLLLTPPGYRRDHRLPLLVYVHGGPIGGFTYGLFPQFMHIVGQVDPYPCEAMASAGMAVLLPMPRGGSGYGLEGFRMIKGSWGEGDFKDIMAGVDHLIAEGVADPERLGVMGGSYGGFMTNWIVTQTGRFKAASTMCSISDLEDLFYLSDAGDFEVEYFGLPWEHPQAWIEHSPITHVTKVTTPLLIQHGENDHRVPIEQATKFYQALKKLGKTVEMEIYPRGGHVIFEPDLEREMMSRNLAWFEKWLKP